MVLVALMIMVVVVVVMLMLMFRHVILCELVVFWRNVLSPSIGSEEGKTRGNGPVTVEE